MVKNLRKIPVETSGDRDERRTIQDEIDLFELAARLLALVRRRKKWLVGGVLLGLLVSLLVYYGIPAQYQSELTVSVPSLKKHEMDRLVSGFRESMTNQKSLSKVQLVDITSENSGAFVVTAAMYDQNEFPKLQAALVEYLSINPFVKNDYESRRTKAQQTISLLEVEELKVASALDILFSSKTIYNAKFSIAELEQLKVEMKKERIALSEEISNLRAVSVIQDFTIPAKACNKNIPKIFSISMVMTLFLTVAAIFIIELFQALDSRSNRY